VIVVNTGHVNVHETGAIEAADHKVVVMACLDRKLTLSIIQAFFAFDIIKSTTLIVYFTFLY
jgi:threonine aldolase